MAQQIAADELIILIILLAGYLPILAMYLRRFNSMLLFMAYTTLLIGGFSEVLKNVAYYDQLVLIKSVVGVFGTGVMLFLCAYLSYRQVNEVHEKINISAKMERHQVKELASIERKKVKEISNAIKKVTKKR